MLGHDKKEESKLNSVEMRVLGWGRGKTALDQIRIYDIGLTIAHRS